MVAAQPLHRSSQVGEGIAALEYQIPQKKKVCMTRSAIVLAGALACSTIGWAQEAPAPALHEGDKWVYSLKVEKPPAGSSIRHWENTIQRVSSTGMVLATKPVDSNLPATETAFEKDWSRMVSINGRTTTTNKYFDFPLRVGKTWEVAVTQEHPTPNVKLLRNKLDYKVIGWEEVTVPAGTFKALKIEADGEWYNEFERTNAVASSVVQAGTAGGTSIAQTRSPTTPEPLTGRFYRAFWYVPEAKREIKSVLETINQRGGISQRDTAELESFTVQP
ncbi:hypothetical protein [Variovorax fucosicus]|uniref:hypothetical protein n=1 Tax=Variovorax fucosicus TaxID=3053517 RepID=UPI0025787A96|nr:hypothetical protein [Variovorax sp. J22G47]